MSRKKTYSTYEAKARFSEILRAVRERGETVTVSYHGEPVAEIRPLPRPEAEDPLTARVRALEAQGVVVAAEGGGGPRRIARRRGSLSRFLAERDAE